MGARGEELRHLLAVARGERPADVVFHGGRVADVFGGELRQADLATAGRWIAAVGPDLRGEKRVDLRGRLLTPGLLDAHVHVESALVPPTELARAVLPRGVTTIVTDPHEIANVCGLTGVRFLLRDAEGAPLSVLVNAPSCVPASSLGTAGAELPAAAIVELLDEPSVLGLAEVMSFPAVVAGEPAVLAKLEAFSGRVIDGHAPGLGGRRLAAYVAAGISSDHESTSVAEAEEKLRLGMAIFLREATNAKNLRALLPLFERFGDRHLAFATDDRQPADLLDQGSIDHLLRLAIAGGVAPMAALRAATLNPAEHYRLGDRGALAPGRRADLVVTADLGGFRAEEVWVEGRLVARDGRAVFRSRPADGSVVRGTVHLPAGGLDFRIPAPTDRPQLRAIGAVPDQLLTELRTIDARIEGLAAVADPARDLAKIAVVERHLGSGRIGRGFVQGLGLAAGALASTFAHDHHNLVVAGVDDASMETAARAVAAEGGGLAAARGGSVLALLPLPLAGLLSDRPVEEVRRLHGQLLTAARELGSPLHDPFMALSFLTLEVIPRLKITDRGLVDVERGEIVPLFV